MILIMMPFQLWLDHCTGSFWSFHWRSTELFKQQPSCNKQFGSLKLAEICETIDNVSPSWRRTTEPAWYWIDPDGPDSETIHFNLNEWIGSPDGVELTREWHQSIDVGQHFDQYWLFEQRSQRSAAIFLRRKRPIGSHVSVRYDDYGAIKEKNDPHSRIERSAFY